MEDQLDARLAERAHQLTRQPTPEPRQMRVRDDADAHAGMVPGTRIASPNLGLVARRYLNVPVQGCRFTAARTWLNTPASLSSSLCPTPLTCTKHAPPSSRDEL